MVAGSVRPLVDAFRIAQVELIEWLVDDYGFDKIDAYQVVSQAGVTRVANVVDPNYTVVAKFPKKLLPAKDAERPTAVSRKTRRHEVAKQENVLALCSSCRRVVVNEPSARGH